MKKTDTVPESRTNVALFLYDSLIPSMLSGLGGTAPTPSFDFFINGGLSFSRASAHSLRNDVVLGSIFTGLYPHRSGIHKLSDDSVSFMANGYFNEKTEDLTARFVLNKYRVRLFNCGELNCSIRGASRCNEAVTAPHMEQLMRLVNESADDPFLAVDRFGTTAFGWRPDFPHDRRETGEEYRDLILSGLSSEKGRRLVLRRMEDAVRREDARLGRFINLMHRHSLMENTLVVLAGIPGDVSKRELDALSEIGGLKEGSPPLFPLTFWYPEGVAPSKDTESMVRHIDIFPTILSICGFDIKDKLDGRDLTANGKAGAGGGTLVFHDDAIEHYGGGKKTAIALDSASSKPRKPTPEEGGSAVFREIGSPSVIPRRHDRLLSEDVIPKKTIFFLTLPRSGSVFFAQYFERPEFENVYTMGHNEPATVSFHWFYGLDEDTKEAMVKRVMSFRESIMSSPKEVFVSVSHHYWNAMDVIAEVFVNAKFVIIMRDPVSQQASCMRVPNAVQTIGKKRGFNPKCPVSYPSTSKHANNKGVLHTLSHFWNSVAVLYYNAAKSLGERAITVHFDEIFSSKKGHSGMKRIAEFIDDEIRIPTNDEYLKTVFSQIVNQYDNSYPAWEKWSDEDKKILLENTKQWRELWGYKVDG